jgi:transcriptional regulator GlxA family with amidase domain
MLGLCFGEALAYALQLAFADRQGGGKTDDYIPSTLEPTNMTPSVKVVPTITYDDAPRNLDILLIGGPMPSHRPAAADKFMKEAVKETKNILTTCTGAMWLASSGVLDGKKATTNRLFLGMAKQMYPNVEWMDQRWVVDGSIWTSGGAFAGKFNLPVSQKIFQSAEDLC